MQAADKQAVVWDHRPLTKQAAVEQAADCDHKPLMSRPLMSRPLPAHPTITAVLTGHGLPNRPLIAY